MRTLEPHTPHDLSALPNESLEDFCQRVDDATADADREFHRLDALDDRQPIPPGSEFPLINNELCDAEERLEALRAQQLRLVRFRFGLPASQGGSW